MKLLVGTAAIGAPEASIPPTPLKYLRAVAIVGIACALRWWLERAFGAMPDFITFYPAVMLLAAIDGRGPGIFATLLSAVIADLFFIPPKLSFAIGSGNNAVALGFFIATCTALSIICGALMRSRAHEALLRQSQLSERLLRTFVENTPAPVAMLDTQMRYVFSSKRWAQDYGLGDQDLTGRSHYELFPEIPERWKLIHQRCLAGAIEHSDEDAFLRSDGHTDWLRWSVHPWSADDGKVGGIIIFSELVTARKRTEDELRRLNGELEEVVAKRTHELQERTLLLQEIHHRVKNNLALISSLINTQVRGLKDSAAQAALGECQQRIHAMALVHEALYESPDYSRVQFSKYARALTENVFRAAGSACGTVQLIQEFDENVSVNIETAITCGLILNELITNALKHAFPGSRPGVVRVQLRALPGDQLQLSVSDDGIGSKADRLAPSQSSMGAMLVTTFAKQLDGVLTVNGEQGTTVTVRFVGGEHS